MCNYTNKTHNLSSRGSKVCNYTKKNNKTNSQRVLETLGGPAGQLQDPLRIGFIGFFGIVIHFGASGIQIIGFIGTVTHFELQRLQIA